MSGSADDEWDLGNAGVGFQGSSAVSSDGSDVPSPGLSRTTPQIYLAVAASAVIAAAALIVFLRSEPLANLVAWLLAGPVALTSAGLYLGADRRMRAQAAVYAQQSWVKPVYASVTVVGFLLAVMSAWFLADWAGRR